MTHHRARPLLLALALAGGTWQLPLAAEPPGSLPAGSSAALQAEWPARLGRLAAAQGDVRLLDREEDRWVAAVPNQPLTAGDHLLTEADARAEIRIGSTTVRLGASTELRLARLDDQAIVLELRSGSLALKLISQAVVPQVSVHTFEGQLRPRQIGHYRIDQRDGATEATAWRGELLFEGRNSQLAIGAGRRAEIWLKGAERRLQHEWREVARDGFADWVAYDDTAQERSISAASVSAEMTGWEELDRHGSWHTHPELGGVWVPAGVAAGWAPYQQGRWVWVSSWGWAWMDQARWGFAPFHYGRWVRWGSRWCWVPGPRVRPPPGGQVGGPPPGGWQGDRRGPKPPPPGTIATLPGGNPARDGGLSLRSRDAEVVRPPERPVTSRDPAERHDTNVVPPRRHDVPTPRVSPSLRAAEQPRREAPKAPAVLEAAKPAEPQENKEPARAAEPREAKPRVPEQRPGLRVQTQ